MNTDSAIIPLTARHFHEAVDIVLRAQLDTREEIEHHLSHIDAHYVVMDNDKVIGVIGWYQDNVGYANDAMGDRFPGSDVYWVGFFAVEKEFRGTGIGYALLERLAKEVKKKGARELWVSSVPETKDYYLRQGFSVVMQGEISGNPKYFMVRKIE